MLDVVVVGAGMAGLYALHHLRELGFSTVVLEAGGGVGGTWYWNRYPGARCDVPSLEYSYGFSEELQQEWEWTEVFPAQAELERYFNHVADRFDLWRDIRLETRVVSAAFDDASATWAVQTDRDDGLTCRFLVLATGPLSVPNAPDVPGLGDFRGLVLQTSRWPADQPALAGQRIGLIGTGSSGVQTMPELAAVAGHLYVFQRTPTFAWPSHNAPLDPEVQADWKRDYVAQRKAQRESFGGVTGSTGAIILQTPEDRRILDTTEAERLAILDERGWHASRVWSDMGTDPEANELAADLYREMVRRTVDDPERAEALSPRGFPIGCKRPVIGSGYFETFNADHVTLVDLRRGGIEAVTETGIETGQGHFELDVIVFATGFDAMTGALARIDIRGRDGVTLLDAWTDGPRTYLGLAIAGFPNLFTVSGPGSPSVLANMVVCSEQHVEWIGACLGHARDRGARTVEASAAAQDAWVEHAHDVARGTMYTAPSCSSWYLGANVPGKPRVFLPYVGGLPAYIEHVERIAASGYEGFTFA